MDPDLWAQKSEDQADLDPDPTHCIQSCVLQSLEKILKVFVCCFLLAFKQIYIYNLIGWQIQRNTGNNVSSLSAESQDKTMHKSFIFGQIF